MKKLTAEELVATVGSDAARSLVVAYEGMELPALTELLKHEQKLQAIHAYLSHEPVPIIEMRYQVKRSTLMRWVKEYKKQHEKSRDAIRKVSLHRV